MSDTPPKGKVIPMRKGLGTSAAEARRGKKVIFGDFTSTKYQTLQEWLKREGITSQVCTDYDGFSNFLKNEAYDLCVVNLLWGGKGPNQLIANIIQKSRNDKLRIIVVSRQVQRVNIQNSLSAGADDFVAEPFENENLFHRIIYHLTPKTVVTTLKYPAPEGAPEVEEAPNALTQLLVEVIELLSHTTRNDLHMNFVKVTQRIAETLGSNRTSLIIVEPDLVAGVVIASSDDPKFSDYPIPLQKYPEILHVVNSGNIVVVDDTSKNSLTERLSDDVKSIQIGSVLVFPVCYLGMIVGVLTVRRPEAMEVPTPATLKIIQAVANVMAAHTNTKFLLRKIYRGYRPGDVEERKSSTGTK